MRRRVVTVKTPARKIVMRSRFFSMMPVPLEVVGMTPLNIEDTPVPLPECKRMKTTSPIEAAECTTKIR